MENEKTFAIIKPEAVAQKLIGKIIAKIEESGLAITKMRMMSVPRALAEKHYAKDDAWCAKIGGGALRDYAKAGRDPKTEAGTDDPIQIGRQIQQRTIAHLISAPVVIMELTGENAAEAFRALCGATEPASADPASIRGLFAKDDYTTSLLEKRPLRNLLHSSGNAEEARAELDMWFGAA
ncbi:MAG: nucleoside-diphosphate kinase [Alphaproteobacteria bacterium]|nr:nucleoside-diphosphate kinase [Alphaproteobacteria bacterium]